MNVCLFLVMLVVCVCLCPCTHILPCAHVPSTKKKKQAKKTHIKKNEKDKMGKVFLLLFFILKLTTLPFPTFHFSVTHRHLQAFTQYTGPAKCTYKLIYKCAKIDTNISSHSHFGMNTYWYTPVNNLCMQRRTGILSHTHIHTGRPTCSWIFIHTVTQMYIQIQAIPHILTLGILHGYIFVKYKVVFMYAARYTSMHTKILCILYVCLSFNSYISV